MLALYGNKIECYKCTYDKQTLLRILRRIIIFQLYRDFEPGDTQSLKANYKWRDPGSNSGLLQAKGLITPPPPLSKMKGKRIL